MDPCKVPRLESKMHLLNFIIFKYNLKYQESGQDIGLEIITSFIHQCKKCFYIPTRIFTWKRITWRRMYLVFVKLRGLNTKHLNLLDLNMWHTLGCIKRSIPTKYKTLFKWNHRNKTKKLSDLIKNKRGFKVFSIAFIQSFPPRVFLGNFYVIECAMFCSLLTQPNPATYFRFVFVCQWSSFSVMNNYLISSDWICIWSNTFLTADEPF